ncbi:MAG: class III signal peptide-containing protein [Alphaproteobacteria bacterium]|nr:class III signal peptide-containing protein [Alphaproteobacteria bacterium]
MRRRGQTTVEYMLLISVLAIALVAALLTFSDVIQLNARSLSGFLATELSGTGSGQQVQ